MTEYRMMVALPTKGRTFLFDLTDAGPMAEFRRALENRQTKDGGMVGSYWSTGTPRRGLGVSVHWLEATFEADTTAKRVLYAAAGIPGYLVVHSGKDWARISEIEEYRLDWSSRRYVVQDVHRRALILDEPFRLTATFDDLQRP